MRPRAVTTLDALPASYWGQLHRVCRPGHPESMIDHVLVGPSGIHVICYQAPSGRLPGQPDDETIRACAAGAEDLRSLLPPRYHDRVRPVLCSREDHERADEVDGVLVASLDTFAHIVRSSAIVLSTSEVGRIHAFLRERLEEVPLAPDTSRGRTALVLRVAAAAAAAAAASIGALALWPDLTGTLGLIR